MKTLLVLAAILSTSLYSHQGFSFESGACVPADKFPDDGWDPETKPFEEIFENYTNNEPLICDQALGSSESAPVWKTFIKNLSQCAPGCVPFNYNAYRNQVSSCHYTGRALDVFAIKCGSSTYQAINAGKFKTIVGCMKRKMRVLYQNGPGRTTGHHDHAHFSIGCSIPGHPIYW